MSTLSEPTDHVSLLPFAKHSVRISDIGLGSNAARITAMRSLPDSEAQKAHQRTAGREGSAPERSEGENGQGRAAERGGEEQAPAEDERWELDGQHVNLEVSFAYRGLPSGQSAASKAKNIQ